MKFIFLNVLLILASMCNDPWAKRLFTLKDILMNLPEHVVRHGRYMDIP